MKTIYVEAKILLDERELRILLLRNDKKTYAQIAKAFGINVERVKQIETSATYKVAEQIINKATIYAEKELWLQ